MALASCGLAGTLMREAANKKSAGLGKNGAFTTKTALLAVTADRIYAFNAKPSGRSWIVADEVDDWARRDVRITTTPGKMSTKVVLDVESTGAHYELEATTVMQKDNFTDRFLAGLTRPLDE